MDESAHTTTLRSLALLLGGDLQGVAAPDSIIREVTADSRAVEGGALFVAVEGSGVDGHQFIPEAVSRGAVAILSQRAQLEAPLPVLRVPDSRLALSILSDFFSGSPSRELFCVGITGTNGKTTTHWLLYHLLNRLGIPAVRFGTLGVYSEGGLSTPGVLTTPDPRSIHRLLGAAKQGGAKAAVFEASSHALDQKRIESVRFDAGIFTNLTRDHLDYHGSMEAYYQAKEHLVELVARSGKKQRLFVSNLDSVYGVRMAESARAAGLSVLGYGRSDTADLQIQPMRQSIQGSEMHFRFREAEYVVASRFIGEHNAENIGAVLALGCGYGWDIGRVCALLGELPMVPGRLEPVGTPRLGVYVDYAHSPDALEKVLATVRPLTTGKVWVVFGCGGDRDRGKRPQMAAVACAGADRVMVTSDNPRSEDPKRIIDDILAGADAVWGTEVDRRTAIQRTIRAADDGDVVLIAGKGHEDYQILGTQKIHFSDQEEACTALALRDRGAACCV